MASPALEPREPAWEFGIVGRSPALRHVLQAMRRAAASDLAIHIFGETGTGKESLARAVHACSTRSRRPFVAVNAACLADALFESEVFGHARGAFTGAVADRRGLVAEAEGGTLFVDEVTELSLPAQAKLLRLLQEGEYRRLGETGSRRCDVRIVTASNTPLSKKVEGGAFRADLMYRLDAIVLALPPLRDRGDDVMLLARHFLERHARRFGRTAPALTPEAAAALRAHSWPGNVRELENEMARILLAADGPEVGRGDLRKEIAQRAPASDGAGPLAAAMQRFERAVIDDALRQHGGVRARTARALGITRQALHQKMRRHGLAQVAAAP